MNIVELFSGTGGFSLGLKNIGKTIWANDIETSSEIIYNQNFDIKLTRQDIHKIKVDEIPSMDILTGGFACQGFSIAGQRKGFNDVRSDVFWKMISIIKHHKPRFVIIENVKNLLTHNSGDSFKLVEKSINDIDYKIKYKVFNSSDFGVRQNRERIYIVCFRDEDDYKKFKFINIEPVNLPVFETDVNDKYYYTDKYKCFDLLKEEIIKKDTFYQYRRVYVRENKSGICPTLVSCMGTGGHNVPLILDDKGIRKLTPRECFNLQGFPSSYKLEGLSDSQLYKLVGNAITVQVAEYIGKCLSHLY